MNDSAQMISEIRAILAAFDWEQDDRQYALEKIERIVTPGPGGQAAELEHQDQAAELEGPGPARDVCEHTSKIGQTRL